MPPRLVGALAALALGLCSVVRPASVQSDPVVPGEEHCVINIRSDDRLNLRSGPSTSSSILVQWRYGQCGVTVMSECQGDWCQVDDGHHSGWAHRHYFAMVSPAMYCVTGVAAWDVLNLRAYPSAASRILTVLDPHQCDIAFLPYASGNWQKVRVGGWEGWASRRYLSGQ